MPERMIDSVKIHKWGEEYGFKYSDIVKIRLFVDYGIVRTNNNRSIKINYKTKVNSYYILRYLYIIKKVGIRGFHNLYMEQIKHLLIQDLKKHEEKDDYFKFSKGSIINISNIIFKLDGFLWEVHFQWLEGYKYANNVKISLLGEKLYITIKNYYDISQNYVSMSIEEILKSLSDFNNEKAEIKKMNEEIFLSA